VKAINLTLSPVELAPINGAGLLLPADDQSDGGHERDLKEPTEREYALARAGTVALIDSAGRRLRKFPEPKPTTTDADSGADDSPGGEA
jgi:hypothetical protein